MAVSSKICSNSVFICVQLRFDEANTKVQLKFGLGTKKPPHSVENGGVGAVRLWLLAIGYLAATKVGVFNLCFVFRFVVRTHVLDKEINELLGHDGMVDDLRDF